MLPRHRHLAEEILEQWQQDRRRLGRQHVPGIDHGEAGAGDVARQLLALRSGTHLVEAPRFDGEKLVKPAYQTLFMNNVLMHNHKEVMGAMVYRKVATYTAHCAEEPLALQDHHNPVRYRNIWLRRVRHYDEPEK